MASILSKIKTLKSSLKIKCMSLPGLLTPCPLWAPPAHLATPWRWRSRRASEGMTCDDGGVCSMAQPMTPADLKHLLDTQATCACIDVREPGEYNSTHIPGTSLVPRRELEFRMWRLVPYQGTLVVVCDDDGQRATLAAATLERMGYSHVQVLDGGINRWTTVGYDTEWGVNVPSKDFGEKMEVVHHVPSMGPEELYARQQRGDNII